MTDSTKPGAGDQPLVGASEAAELMGIELSTFSHLRRREETEDGSKFPKPYSHLRCGPIWKTTDIQRFAKRYEKPRPGPKPGQIVRTPRASKTSITGFEDAPTNGNGKVARKLAAVKTPAKAATKPVTKPIVKKTVAKKATAKVPAPVA